MKNRQVAMNLRYNKLFSNYFTTNLPLNLLFKEVLKLAKSEAKWLIVSHPSLPCSVVFKNAEFTR